MADVKVLFRESPREEYFYRLGFQEGYKAAKSRFAEDEWPDALDLQLASVTKNALDQVPDKEPTYYG